MTGNSRKGQGEGREAGCRVQGAGGRRLAGVYSQM